MDTDTTAMSSEALRARMVEKVRKVGHAHRADVERVLLDTPRHEFVPDADLAHAYDPWQAVVTHRFDDGRALSCASAPWLVAAMLDQLHVEPGDRVLEIGAGTGYNAGLLAQLAGRADLVTTIDIDPDVTAQASSALTATGYGDVHVITGDGGLGYPDHAPYDRMIATVSPWDIPAPWWNQPAPRSAPCRAAEIPCQVSVLSLFDQPGGESMLRCCRGSGTESAFALAGRDNRSGGPSPISE